MFQSFILYMPLFQRFKAKVPSAQSTQRTVIQQNYFRNPPCSRFSSCQTSLHLWDFCPPWAAIGDLLGISSWVIVSTGFWVRKTEQIQSENIRIHSLERRKLLARQSWLWEKMAPNINPTHQQQNNSPVTGGKSSIVEGSERR